MNERIRELAEQAGFFPELNWDHTGWHAAGHNNTFEKFAELIVRECCLLTQEYQHRVTYYRADEIIMKHFGVEE
jgi:hypothetical protein